MNTMTSVHATAVIRAWQHALADLMVVAMAAIVVLLGGCGGGGGGGGGGGTTSVVPPNGLSYPAAPAYVVGQAIAPLSPTVSGVVSSYASDPALPAGLNLDPATGVISGTPTQASPPATYTISARNDSGSATAALVIVVNGTPPVITYASPYYAFTRGVPAQTITPSLTPSSTAVWSVTPSLPPGLTLHASDGTIDGTPTSGFAADRYVVTATTASGAATAVLSIAVSANPLLDLGHSSVVDFFGFNGDRLLSRDIRGNWLLWDYAAGSIVARGVATSAEQALSYLPIALVGPTVVIQTSNGLEIRSASTGEVLSVVAAAPSWWLIATDGSYVCAGAANGLTVWSPAGQVMLSRTGDYSAAMAFAAPAELRIARGPAGANVVETISLASGGSAVGPAFLGQFRTWFLDGERFLSTLSNTTWVYSKASVQVDIAALPTINNLAGRGDWYWTLSGPTVGTMNLYAVGSGGQLAATYANLNKVVPGGTTIGLLPYGSASVSVLDLSGPTPTRMDYSLPVAYLSGYAAVSPSTWLVGNSHGVVVDGAPLPTRARVLTYGDAWSIAASPSRIAIATASGRIVYYDARTLTLEGTIDFASSSIGLSLDGTVLAAAASSADSQYEPDRTLNVYALPGGARVNTLPFTINSSPKLRSMSLSASGQVLALTLSPAITCGSELLPAFGGAPTWCDPSGRYEVLQMSPDAILYAGSTKAVDGGVTNLYSGGTLVSAVPGSVAGWIDSGRLLVNRYVGDPVDLSFRGYAGASIYDPSGNLLGTPPISEIRSFQTVAADSVYVGNIPDSSLPPKALNTIVSLTTGATLWASGSGAIGRGAVAGDRIVFVSGRGAQVLAEPHD